MSLDLGCCREKFTIKWILKRGLRKSLVKMWKWGSYREYFMQDNIKTPFNRLVGCKLFGHQHIKEDCHGRKFCFNCYRQVGEK